MDTYNNDRIVHASNMLRVFYRNRGFLKAVVHPADFDLGPSGSATMTLVLKITENNAYQLGIGEGNRRHGAARHRSGLDVELAAQGDGELGQNQCGNPGRP